MDNKQLDAASAARQALLEGKTFLGIELGSTRIKAVLIGEDYLPIASGSHSWENRLEQGVWTYRLEDVWAGLRACYAALTRQVEEDYGVTLETVGGIGISAMMHGYLAFNREDKLLVPFRTWRNTMTEEAARLLTEALQFNIPQRWSIAHLYQAILNKESHVNDIHFLTTLAGYVHRQLTGEKVLGVGDASGVFPVDSATNNYHRVMMETFSETVQSRNLPWTLEEILPSVLSAGERAGALTPQGAALLDPAGNLKVGIPFCPPEGDAGTGMVATNSVAKRTGNVSAGTSIFAMIVLEKELSRLYTEIDMVTTPNGSPVAMVHCNNCTTDLDAWVNLFNELLVTMGAAVDKPALYDALYFKGLEGEADGGGLLSYNYYSGEPITGFDEGRPLFARLPDSRLSLGNFMRTLLYSTIATLKIGMDILTEKEQVKLQQLYGHGGLFKTEGVGQRLMAGALKVPVAVMESAAEGGAWGIALLAAYPQRKEAGQTLEDYLNHEVFKDASGSCVQPAKEDAEGFDRYMERYKQGLAIQKAATDTLK